MSGFSVCGFSSFKGFSNCSSFSGCDGFNGCGSFCVLIVSVSFLWVYCTVNDGATDPGHRKGYRLADW